MDCISSSRSLIENAVQSCLLLPKLSLENANKARLLRAKARLAASLHAGAYQGRDPSRPWARSFLDLTFPDTPHFITDLEAILSFDPDHPEARILMGRSVPSGKVSFAPLSLLRLCSKRTVAVTSSSGPNTWVGHS